MVYFFRRTLITGALFLSKPHKHKKNEKKLLKYLAIKNNSIIFAVY